MRQDSTIGSWIENLGDDLMWIGMFSDREPPKCLPNHDRPCGEIRGWRELLQVLQLVPDLLSAADPCEAGYVIVRTHDALYVAACPEGRPSLVLGIEPSIPLARLGFDWI